MKITYLGTAASMGFPGVFCNCRFCREARRLGGKNIRTRSQSLINDDLLIDFPADSYGHFLNNGIEPDKIKYLLITHSHRDHLCTDDLDTRHGVYAYDMRAEELKIYCSTGAFEKIKALPVQEGFSTTLIKPYEKIILDGYEIIPLPARHFEGDGAVIYIIKSEGKTLLYGNDTGFFYEEIFDFIEKEKLYFDLISLDCTYVDHPVSDSGGHMGIENINRLIGRLAEISAVDEKTEKYLTHFSHKFEPLQQVLETKAARFDLKVAFDGAKIEI